MSKKIHYYFLVLLSATIPFLSNARELPAPTGPYAVGTIMYHWIDSSRFNPSFSDKPAHYRELMAQVWYPSEKKENPVFSPYIPAFGVIDELKKQLSALGFNKSYIKEILSVQTHSVPGAGLSAAQQKFPLIIFMDT